MTKARALVVFGLAVSLAACAGHAPRSTASRGGAVGAQRGVAQPADTYRPQSERYRQSQDNGPSAPPIDVSRIPEPVPKVEPLSRYGNKPVYSVLGETYHVLPSAHGYVERGLASWYGNKFHGYMTSSFEPYDMYSFTAAHKTLPLPSYARVTNLANGKSVVVRINDRGPFHSNRIIDLSYAAAVKIGVWPKGTAMVEVRALDPGHPETRLPPLQTAAVTVPARLAPAPRVTAPSSATHDAPRIYVQLGSYGERGNAERVAANAMRAGLGHVDIESVAVSGHTVHRVRVGPVTDSAAAEALTARIETLGFGVPRVAIQR